MNSIDSPTILVIDVGTTSTRASLYDARVRCVEGLHAEKPNHLETSPDGGAVFDATRLLEAVVAVIDEVLEKAGSRTDSIAAVAFDTFVSNVLGLDAAGAPITPVYTYADTRNQEDARALRAELGPEGVGEVHRRSGCTIHASYLPARFLWLERVHPQLFRSVRSWVSFGEYLFEIFFGSRLASHSIASWTGMLDHRKLAWDSFWLQRLPIDEEQLSPLGDLSETSRGLRGDWAKRWPALNDVPWLPAIGDGAAANIGSGCDVPEHVALTIGSTGAMRVVVEEELDSVPKGLWLYRVDRSRGLLGGATTEGGHFFAWLRRTLQLPAPEALEREIATRSPTAHGLTILPFVSGERAPGWREDARAAIVGLTLSHDPIDVVHAALEAMAYRFALIHERMTAHFEGREDSYDIIAGGGALLNSPAWLQIMADALGRPVVTLAEEDVTSRGLGLLALENLGVIGSPSDLPPATGRVHEPEESRHLLHKEALGRQVALYDRLLDDGEL